MTPERLQKDLVEELSKLFENIEFRNSSGEKCRMNFFEQVLPHKESDDEPEPFPWCVVKLKDNDVKMVGDLNQKQAVELHFGIYYDNPDCQYQHVMLTMFECVKKRFLVNPLFGPFMALPDIVSVMDDLDSETYPFYFGGMALQFEMPNYEREDEYS